MSVPLCQFPRRLTDFLIGLWDFISLLLTQIHAPISKLFLSKGLNIQDCGFTFPDKARAVCTVGVNGVKWHGSEACIGTY